MDALGVALRVIKVHVRVGWERVQRGLRGAGLGRGAGGGLDVRGVCHAINLPPDGRYVKELEHDLLKIFF